MHEAEDGLDSVRLRLLVTALLVVVAAVGALDLYFDDPESWFTPHVLVELMLIAVSTGTAIFLWRGWRRTAESLVRTQRSLVEREAERDAWRTRAEHALEGFRHAIDEQFTAWGLTPSERDVALQLLKGHGHKQIAAQTGRSERTVRQHAVAVYEKSGLGGRAELAAFFLDALH